MTLAGIVLAAVASLGPYTASGNFAADLAGQVDTRPGTWGTAEAATLPVTFRPPAGYRVRVLRLRGDLVAWPRVLPGEKPVEAGQYAGVLLGFQTSAPEASERCDYCADNTMLYVQGAVAAGPTRAPFDYAAVDFLLAADHRLVVKVASWLNTTGRAVHIEATWTVVFRYEREER